jgi:hypothetical protein
LHQKIEIATWGAPSDGGFNSGEECHTLAARPIASQSCNLADHIFVAGQWREDVEALGQRRRCNWIAGSFCAASGKGKISYGKSVSDRHDSGGRA